MRKERLSRSVDREWIFRICYAASLNGMSVKDNYQLVRRSHVFTLSDFGKLYLKIMDRYLNSDELMDPLKRNLEKIHLNRLSNLEKVLIQMGVAEMKYILDIPVEVTIDEILNLADIYGEDMEKRLINSVLDKISRDLREREEINIGFFG